MSTARVSLTGAIRRDLLLGYQRGGGVLSAQATNITDYDGATKMLTYTAVTEAPAADDEFVIV